ncbi:MAG TPA: alcohol dehydrogenase catalytic domain-containing protein [Baekduia sp.]|nr:alcohol dehydrogenase catalytic domain-containing protein [Baekduia sp.]
METRALMVERDLTVRVGTRTLPEPAADEALIAVEWAGICGSDLHVLRTGDWVVDWPATLGHELYGRVLAAPEGSGLSPGDAVVSDSRLACGTCDWCRVDPDRCPHIQFVGELRPGGFASHCVLPARILHRVDPGVAGSTAVLAEPLAVALHALSHLDHAPRRAAILGHGPIGALVHAELRRRAPGCAVDVAEPAALRAQLAEALGGRVTASSAELDPAAYDVVVDAAGYATSLADALALGAPGAHVLLVALGHAEAAVHPAALVERRLRVTGCHAFVDELPEAIRLLSEEGWRYDPVVTAAVALDDLPGALAALLDRPDDVKVLVRP